ncbi:VanZ family protein [Microbacterium terregens]|uniref:VanZ family protein n=1 Tax=Microbacterium terregens TaxID=69363 RepID=A0ABV5T3L1_9MICO
MTSAESAPRTTRRTRARLVLTVYAVTLAIIALWPVPVDSGAGPFLRTITQVIPALTYARIEFSANILLFVPLGVLLMLILRRRYLILPVAIVVTVAIECAQGLLLDKRTPSTLDIIANTAGACIGMLIVAFVEYRRARPARLPAGRMPQRDNPTDAWATLGFLPPPVPPLPLVPPRPPRPTGAALAASRPPRSGAALAASPPPEHDSIPPKRIPPAPPPTEHDITVPVPPPPAPQAEGDSIPPKSTLPLREQPESDTTRPVRTMPAQSQAEGDSIPSKSTKRTPTPTAGDTIPSVRIPPKPPLPGDVQR